MGNNSSQQLDPSYTLRLPDGTAYLGLPIRVAVSRSGAPVESGAYVCLCTSTGRSIQCKEITGPIIQFDAIYPLFEDMSDGTLIAKLYIRGCFHTLNKVICSTTFSIVSPVKNIRIRTDFRDGLLRCFVELRTPLPKAKTSLRLCANYQVLGSCPIDTTNYSGDYTLPLPRLPGTYSVSLQQESNPCTVLCRGHVRVRTVGKRYSISVMSPCNVEMGMSTLCVAPRTSLQFRVSGAIQHHHDVILIVPTTDFNVTDLNVKQDGVMRVTITTKGTATFVSPRCGRFMVVLLLSHGENIYLPADYYKMYVTEPPELPYTPHPVILPLICLDGSEMSTSSSSSSMAVPNCTCCICLEKPPEMKLEPCKHVCMCEACYIAMSVRERPEHDFPCPQCRQSVVHGERVYL